eukprot:3172541-Amphidinium_carterae.1
MACYIGFSNAMPESVWTDRSAHRVGRGPLTAHVRRQHAAEQNSKVSVQNMRHLSGQHGILLHTHGFSGDSAGRDAS